MEANREQYRHSSKSKSVNLELSTIHDESFENEDSRSSTSSLSPAGSMFPEHRRIKTVGFGAANNFGHHRLEVVISYSFSSLLPFVLLFLL